MFVVYLSFVHKASDSNLNFTDSRSEHPIHGQKLRWTVLLTLPQNLQYLCYCAVTKVHKRRTRWRKKDWSRETKRTRVPASVHSRACNRQQVWLNYVTGGERFHVTGKVHGEISPALRGVTKGEMDGGAGVARDGGSLLQRPRGFCQLC